MKAVGLRWYKLLCCLLVVCRVSDMGALNQHHQPSDALLYESPYKRMLNQSLHILGMVEEWAQDRQALMPTDMIDLFIGKLVYLDMLVEQMNTRQQFVFTEDLHYAASVLIQIEQQIFSCCGNTEQERKEIIEHLLARATTRIQERLEADIIY